MENNNLELRMYSLVMYNLSPIQQGIQAYHATVEATNNFDNINSIPKNLYEDWAKNWKTVILLNGGSSVTMEEHFETLWTMGVGFSHFREPDLNNSMSAISFVVDERIFNKTRYPDFDDRRNEKAFWERLTSARLALQYNDGAQVRYENQLESLSREVRQSYDEWVASVGGEHNANLRNWLSNFRLA